MSFNESNKNKVYLHTTTCEKKTITFAFLRIEYRLDRLGLSKD